MQLSPPGIGHRKKQSRPLEEAGLIFESLYRKYSHPLDLDRIQKQTEEYLRREIHKKELERSSIELGEKVKGIVENEDIIDKSKAHVQSRPSPKVMTSEADSLFDKRRCSDDGLKSEPVPDTRVNIDFFGDATSTPNAVLENESHLCNVNLSRKGTKFPTDISTFYKTAVLCIFAQVFASSFLIAIIYSIVHYDAYKHVRNITVLYPFLVLIILCQCIFHPFSNKLRRSFLVYSNDINVNVLRKRIVRQEAYNNLYRLSVIGERCLAAACVIIACLPCNFELNLTDFTFAEYCYIISLANLFLLHYIFTYIYFCILFSKAIKKSLNHG